MYSTLYISLETLSIGVQQEPSSKLVLWYCNQIQWVPMSGIAWREADVTKFVPKIKVRIHIIVESHCTDLTSPTDCCNIPSTFITISKTGRFPSALKRTRKTAEEQSVSHLTHKPKFLGIHHALHCGMLQYANEMLSTITRKLSFRLTMN